MPTAKPTLEVKLLDQRATLPRYAHPGDAGMDVFPLESFWIHPGERKLIKLGIALGIPENHEVQIRPRSGLALKYGISIVNSPATIDQGYTGEIGVILINHDAITFTGNPQTAIAQLVLAPVARAQIWITTDLPNTDRAEAAYGSTDSL